MNFFFNAVLLISLIALVVSDNVPLKKKPRVLSLPLTIEQPEEKPKIVSGPTPESFQVEITFVNGTSTVITPESVSVPTASRQNGDTPDNPPPRSNQSVVPPILQSKSSFIRIPFGSGLSPGGIGRIGFKVKFTGVDGNSISDARFFRRLTFEERRRYTALRQQYSGGLNIPLLKFLGGDLSKEFVGKEDFKKAKYESGRFFQLRYGRLSRTAQDILRQYTETTIEGRGEISASSTGESTDSTVYIYFRTAVVKIDETTSLKFLSSDSQDVFCADIDGNRKGIGCKISMDFITPVRR